MYKRQLLADPEWANKAKLGIEEEIRPCIGCNIACVGHIFEGLPQECAVNANVMREKEMDVLIPAREKKKVAIIGAGIAGMECARIASHRGHHVIIYEKSSELGGTFISASVPKDKSASKRLLAWYKQEMEKARVKIRFNCEISEQDLERIDADEIVIAVGNVPKIPKIPGVDQDNVLDPVKVLTQKQTIPEGSRIVIVGGGLVGCETALWLSQEKGFKDITIIEGMDRLMSGGAEPQPVANRLMIADLLEHQNIKVKLNCMLNRVEGNKVVVNCGEKEQVLEADRVILSLGLAENDKLYKEAYQNIPKKVWRIGDALSASNLMYGIRNANAVAREI